ncbi:MAG: exo-alpha-sialidase [Euryarchaeota archaeon]|nr:exo-alpha-sialidase [Euryarchaeota archaeon]
MRLRIALLIALLLVGGGVAAPWQHREVDSYSSYPALAEFNGSYVLVYSKHTGGGARNLFLRHSPDGLSWSPPERLTEFNGTDYQPYLLVDRQKSCWLVFTRKPPEKGDYDIYLMRSEDCRNWSTPVPFIQTHTSDWYPFIYQDSKGTYWLFLSRMVFNQRGEVANAIFYTRSRDGVQWEELEQVTSPVGAVFPRMVETEGGYLLFFSAFTGSWENLSRVNEHNLFVMRSEDGENWSRAARISLISQGKFVLYLDAKRDSGGRVWVAYTSDEGINEEVYLFSSPDGVRWSQPERITRNAEYIASREQPTSFKCDQKALLIDGERFIIAYSCAISRDSPLFVAVGRADEPEDTYLLANFTLDLSPEGGEGEGGEVGGTSGGAPPWGTLIITALGVLALLAYCLRRR